MPPRITPEKRKAYGRLREDGHTRSEAARRAGVSRSWAEGFDKQLQNSSGKFKNRSSANPFRPSPDESESGPGPKTRDDMVPEAVEALDDIRVFARRYFGLVLQPFQEYATEKVMELAASPDEEYLVINQFPGSGKSTFYALVLPAWLTCRDRRIRGLIGSGTDTQAKWYVNNLREAFSTAYPITASPDDIRVGIAVDALASLTGDYGRFRPDDNAIKWAQDGFYVELPGGIATVQKEPTWSAFGLTSGFLGLRVPIAIWDDVYDPQKMRSADSRDDLKERWSNVCEKRLEPGGLLLMQMQRLDPDDISRYCLDMGGTVIREGEEGGKKYHHIVFKAHYPEHCKEDHGSDATPYDPRDPTAGGCLLYPLRMPYSKVESEQQNNPNFEMVYQQADVARARALVDRLWVNGGTDPDTREVYPGCVDKDRDLCEIPKNLAGQLLSVVTADPSPTMYWAIQWWVVRVDAEHGPVERYLIDMHRQKMGANDFLDWHNESQSFTGLMQEWQARSHDLGAPITHWIVEQNAAARFILQFEHIERWIRRWGVTVKGHETHRNKSDAEFGVQTIGSQYKYGRVRLPYRWDTDARLRSQKLVDEVTRWPNGRTDDTVMAHWFLEWNLPDLVEDLIGTEDPAVGTWTPSFVANATPGVAA